MSERIPSDAEEIIKVINQQTTAHEIQLSELNDHLGAIAGQLERIANDIAVHVHEGDL